MDVLLSGHVNDLLAGGEITDEMASSLINDSANAARITMSLIDIATILYKPEDKHIDNMDDRNAEKFHRRKMPAREVCQAGGLFFQFLGGKAHRPG